MAGVVGLHTPHKSEVLKALEDARQHVEEHGARGIAITIVGDDTVFTLFEGRNLELMGATKVLSEAIFSDSID